MTDGVGQKTKQFSVTGDPLLDFFGHGCTLRAPSIGHLAFYYPCGGAGLARERCDRHYAKASPDMNNPLFLNTTLLGESTSEEVAAAGAAGLDQIELWRQYAESIPEQPGAGRLRAHTPSAAADETRS